MCTTSQYDPITFQEPPEQFVLMYTFLVMFQLPLIAITDMLAKIKGMGGKTTGNVIFWVSFVLVGQPLAVLLYFFAWQAKYGSASKPEFRFHLS